MNKNHQLPTNEGKGKFKAPKEKAVGIQSVISSLGHVQKYMKAGQAFATMRKMNQKGGFDCPGCAWPDPEDERSSLGEFCENGIKAIAEEATKRRLDPGLLNKKSLSEISGFSDFEIGKLGRIDRPYYKSARNDHYREIKWEEANNKISKKLKSIQDPDEAVFYTSGRTSNEAAFLYQLMVRKFGTNNLPDCSNMCHEASGKGLGKTLGIGKGSVKLEDLHEAELIIISGQNPGTNHPRMLSALEKCKENGGKIISINPLKEAGLIRFNNPQRLSKTFGKGTSLTDLYLQVRINGDVALLKAIMIRLLEEEKKTGGILDLNFIEQKSAGWAEFKLSLLQSDLDQCVKESGVSLDEINKAVQLISQSNKIIACWAMGLTQHINGVQNIQEIVNLLLMKGAIGKPGAGTCPVRGHSNVQGDRTMGIWEAPPESFLLKLDDRFQFTAPRKHGYAVVDAIKAMNAGNVKFLMCMGGNLLSAAPDTEYTAEGMANCDMVVHVSTKLNRSHLVVEGESLILPCKGRTEKDIQNGKEQFVSVENSMGLVHSSHGVLNPVSNLLKSEVEIICDLAYQLFKEDQWITFKSDYNFIRQAISDVIPGFENYNDRIKNPSGFYLPNGARIGEFETKTRKANFTVNPIPENNLAPDEFVLMTIRSHDQYNTTIYGNHDRYRGIKNMRRIVFMNADDMKEMGIKNLKEVDLVSRYNEEERRVSKFKVVPYDIPSRNLAAYFPETNPLVHIEAHDKTSKTPASKCIRVWVEF